MTKTFRKIGIGRIALVSMSLAAIVFAVALLGRSPITAAELSPYDLQQENQELREILNYFGNGPVDVYATLKDLADSNPALTNVKPMRPAVVFGKNFYRFRDNVGDIVMIAPSTIAAIRVSAQNNPLK